MVVSGSTVCRTLRRLGYTRKKVQQIARQRCQEFRGAFLAQVLQFPRDFFVWVDETGCDLRTNIRRFGYSLLGQSPQYTRLLTRGKRISAICAMSSEGLVGVEFKTDSVDSDAFFDFVRGTLIPNMQPFDGLSSRSIAIMDNCSIHHVDIIKAALQDAGIVVFFLTPYSPDLNPIEELFSSIKYYLKDYDEMMQSVPADDITTIIQAAFECSFNAECI